MPSERIATGSETYQDRFVLATLDIENPDRPYLFNDVIRKISRTLGTRPKPRVSEDPNWFIWFGTNANITRVMFRSYDKDRMVDWPAYDELTILKLDHPRGRGWLEASDSISGLTSIELEGNKVIFVQDLEDWTLRYSLNRDGRPEIDYKSKARPT